MFGPYSKRTLLSGLLLVAVLTAGCTSLMRGFERNELVSNGYPPVTIGTSLPMNLSGQFSPMVLSEMAFITPHLWLAVYGAETPAAPMALVAYSTAPDLYQWDLPGISWPDNPVTSQVAFGERTFNGTLRVVSAANDPFAGFAGATPNKPSDMRWLVQRYTSLEDFRKTKIILEYREPLPASLESVAENITWLGSSAEAQAFIRRAEAAFTVSFAYTGGPIPAAPSLKNQSGVNLVEIGRFLGSLSPIEPMLFDPRN